MTALNWIGAYESVFGSKDSMFGKYFKGTFGVTIGDAISGNYGTTLQSYFGPYITHCVDTRWLGLAGFLGRYLNDLDPFMGMVAGIGGYVTWVYGPNITVNYGGPAGTISRAKSFTKTAYTAEKTGIPLGLWGSETDLVPAPKGQPPKGVEADEIATADKKVLLAVNLLSMLLNYTVAALELAAKFKYSSFDPNDKHITLPDPSEDNYPLGGIDFVLGKIPSRIMGVIYCLELAGSWSTWGENWVKGAKDFFKDLVSPVTVPAKYLEAKLEKAGMNTEDAISTLVFAVVLLGVIIGIAALAAGS
jgi:hypothetical protein